MDRQILPLKLHLPHPVSLVLVSGQYPPPTTGRLSQQDPPLTASLFDVQTSQIDADQSSRASTLRGGLGPQQSL